MAHAHNRTLLAKLGFADPDRKEPLHDMACRYLSEPEQAVKILATFIPRKRRWDDDPRGYGWGVDELDVPTMRAAFTSATIEKALSKGDDTRFKTTIGFLDLVLRGEAYGVARPEGLTPERLASWRDAIRSEAPNPAWRLCEGRGGTAVVEVKIQPVSYSELLRQINLYREYWDDDDSHTEWVAALAFQVNETYVRTLASENVRVVRLGDMFRQWVEEQKNDVSVARVLEV